MTEEERKFCRDLIWYPWGKEPSKEDFLRRFPSAVEQGKLSLRLLEEAYKARNSVDIECALVVGFSFGFGPEHTAILCRLVDEDWHEDHENVVSALDELRTPLAIEALFRATQWIPGYLDFDEARALAVKAIWALGNLPGPEAETKLKAIARSDDAILRTNAEEQLERRREGL
jgi:hypothetical protein